MTEGDVEKSEENSDKKDLSKAGLTVAEGFIKSAATDARDPTKTSEDIEEDLKKATDVLEGYQKEEPTTPRQTHPEIKKGKFEKNL